MPPKPPLSDHASNAKELLEEAAEMILDGEDAIEVVSEALANLKAEVGELDAAEAAELLRMSKKHREGADHA